MQLYITVARKNLYLSIVVIFKSIQAGMYPPNEALVIIRSIDPNVIINIDVISQYLNKLSVKELKKYDLITRQLLNQTIREFYRNAGYDVSDAEPGHILTMIAFMVKLIDDEIKAFNANDFEKVNFLRKIQHRFLNTYLIPLLKEVNDDDLKIIKIISALIENDMLYLRECLLQK